MFSAYDLKIDSDFFDDTFCTLKNYKNYKKLEKIIYHLN